MKMPVMSDKHFYSNPGEAETGGGSLGLTGQLVLVTKQHGDFQGQIPVLIAPSKRPLLCFQLKLDGAINMLRNVLNEHVQKGTAPRLCE